MAFPFGSGLKRKVRSEARTCSGKPLRNQAFYLNLTMETLQANEMIFAITKEDLQYEAKEKIGRELTDEEILEVKERLEFAIGENLLFIYGEIFNEMMEP